MWIPLSKVMNPITSKSILLLLLLSVIRHVVEGSSKRPANEIEIIDKEADDKVFDVTRNQHPREFIVIDDEEEENQNMEQVSSSSSLNESATISPSRHLMDIETLSKCMSALSTDELRSSLKALGEHVGDSLKEGINWNLLHEAVFIDSVSTARLLLSEFNFDPNAFDPYFGSAMYLIQNRPMAELLKEFGGNLLDQRSCFLYFSALGSSKVRNKLGIVSLIENYDIRMANMLKELEKEQAGNPEMQFRAPRTEIFNHALSIVNARKSGKPCSSIFVKFGEEDGVDCGGLTCEFINLIKDKVIENGKVITFGEDGLYYLVPDKESGKLPTKKQQHFFSELKLFGFIIGLSIYKKVPLDIKFQPIVYYILTGLNPHRDIIDWSDIFKETDTQAYTNNRYVIELSDNEREGYEFPEIQGDSNKPWKKRRIEIKTAEDSKDYLQIFAKDFVYLRYEKALTELKFGFNLALNSRTISRFITPKELEISMMGENDYTAEEWREACAPPEHDPKYNEMYEWFWQIVDEISKEERAQLLKFTTALISLPQGGFKALKEYKPTVLIFNMPDKTDFFPESSTCMNRIKLYPASSYEKLKEKLLYAIKNCNSAFYAN